MTFWTSVAVVSAALGSALIGGIFFAFSNFIMKALARLPASTGIEAMQSVNIVVLNRWFLGIFSGTALLSIWLAGYAITNWGSPAAPWVLGGSFAYAVGSWLLTIAGNVPLNNRLAAATSGDEESEVIWQHYVKRWTALNSQRAGNSVLAALLFIIGLTRGLDSALV